MLLFLLFGLAGAGEPTLSTTSKDSTFDLVMPGARPMTDDSYICSGFDIPELTGVNDTVYITGFVPDADANRAHHILLYSCEKPLKPPGQVYDCLHHTLCNGANSIVFAWAKNAPPTTLPKDVAFKMDTSSRQYMVMQVHYAHPMEEADHTALSIKFQKEPTTYQAGILLMLEGSVNIPANREKVHADINCKLPAQVPLHFFSFRTHAHALGSVISGYVYNEQKNEYREIAKGSPQWPQAFYPMKQVQTVKPGEILAARCTFNSMGRNTDTHIGSSAGDEMCNLYMMFFVKPGTAGDFLMCFNKQEGDGVSRALPAGNDDPPPKNEVWEQHAKDSKVDTGINEINYGKLFMDEMEAGTSKKKGGLDENSLMVADYNFTMPGAQPRSEDEYLCTSVSMADIYGKSRLWIMKFSALTTGNRAHHMILSKCRSPVKREGETYDCRHHQTCNDQSKILFAWAKHAEPTELPFMVGFAVQPEDHLVLQVHYSEPLSEPDYSGLTLRFSSTEPKYTAGIMLLGSSHLTIPPNTETTHADANCQLKAKTPIHVFAYRTHAHSYGSVISGYRYTPSSGDWGMIAKGNPQWPQAFYPMQKESVVNPGEIMAARCSYNTTGHFQSVKIGPTGGDEMCNLYLMFYTVTQEDDFIICFDEQNPALSSQLPPGNDEPLPRNPALEHKAHGMDLNQNGQPSAPSSSSSSSPSIPAMNDAASADANKMPKFIEGATKLMPQVSSSVLIAAAISVPLSLLIACCLAIRKCRKRGKGTMLDSNKKKNWNLGDILGRSKDGFQPVNTEERDGLVGDESDSEVEEFSVPALRA